MPEDKNNQKETKKEKSKKSKFLFFTVFLIIIGIVFYLVLQFYLTANLLLGNDILITLTSNTESMSLLHGQTDIAKFNIYVLTNPFCKAECNSEFIDLSSNKTIDKSSFILEPPNSRIKEYLINATRLGTGQDLFRFDVECKSVKTTLCQTKGNFRSRSMLLALNYDLNNEEQKFKQQSRERIILFVQDLNYFESNLKEFSPVTEELEKTMNVENLTKNISILNKEISNFYEIIDNLKNLWENQDYSFLMQEITTAENKLLELKNDFEIINITLSSNIEQYNKLIERLSFARQELTELRSINVTENISLEIDNAIKEFNNITKIFTKQGDLSFKENITEELINDINNLSLTILVLENETNITRCCFANEIIADVKMNKIDLKEATSSAIDVVFKEPYAVCCLFGKCGKCCDEACQIDRKLYPVILLHGHDFNKKISAEHSLLAFEKIQEKLDNDGYLNAGSLILGILNETQRGIWGKIYNPVSVKVSYYFDIYKNLKEGKIIQTKADSLDTYAIRLRDIINLVKYKTNRDKVIIVAHSMGGLVTRRYMQLFGENDINKLIMIGTPNAGIGGNILSYCSLFGGEMECRDMGENSLFINKLNTEEMPTVPIYNIVGIGCKMGNETGDGIVKMKSTYVESAKNYFINGTCSGFNYLHEEMLDIDKYPIVYDIIKGAIKG